MRRSALKKNLSYPLAIKLFKKRKNYIKDYFQKHMPHGSSSKNFWKLCKALCTN